MKFLTPFLIAEVTVLLFLGLIGVTYSPMSPGPSGHMSGCPFMGGPALCHMSPLDHAYGLQNMLTAVPFSGVFAFFVLLLLALTIVAAAPIVWNSISILLEPLLKPPVRAYRFIPRHTLQEAFSNGILHSKVF